MTPLQEAATEVVKCWRKPKAEGLARAIAMLSSALTNEVKEAK